MQRTGIIAMVYLITGIPVKQLMSEGFSTFPGKGITITYNFGHKIFSEAQFGA